MMVSKEERAGVRRFVCDQLRDEPDLSTLTLGVLKRRYLAHVGRDSLSPEAKQFMKQVVGEELMKMQDNDKSGSELDTDMPQNKRKRENENDEVISENEDESRAKKSRSDHLRSPSESKDKEDCKTGSEESDNEKQSDSQSDDAEQDGKKSQQKKNGKGKQQVSSDDSADEEINNGNESNCDESPEEMVKKNRKTRSDDTNEGKKTPQSDEENETDDESKSGRSDKSNGDVSSDDSEKDEKGGEESVEKKNDDPDSDSSSLPSLEDEQDGQKENMQDNKKKKKSQTHKQDKSARGQKDDNKAVVRLKRYIALCGVRKNYKKLLEGHKSIRAKVALLKKELEDLGVHGQPSIVKCKKVRMLREESQELAELDASNIITTQGRPKRRGAWQEKRDPPSPSYQRTLNSGSDSDQENDTHRGRRRMSQWTNLQGIISDDADSD